MVPYSYVNYKIFLPQSRRLYLTVTAWSVITVMPRCAVCAYSAAYLNSAIHCLRPRNQELRQM